MLAITEFAHEILFSSYTADLSFEEVNSILFV